MPTFGGVPFLNFIDWINRLGDIQHFQILLTEFCPRTYGHTHKYDDCLTGDLNLEFPLLGGPFSQLSSFDQPFRKYNIDSSQIKYC